MSKEFPEAWTASVHGPLNEGVVRQHNQERWQRTAAGYNSERSLGQKITGRGKVDAEERMIDEAHEDNVDFDRAKESGEVPDFLMHEKVGQTILKESGVKTPKRFSHFMETAEILGDQRYPEVYQKKVRDAKEKVLKSAK